ALDRHALARDVGAGIIMAGAFAADRAVACVRRHQRAIDREAHRAAKAGSRVFFHSRAPCNAPPRTHFYGLCRARAISLAASERRRAIVEEVQRDGRSNADLNCDFGKNYCLFCTEAVTATRRKSQFKNAT